MSKVLILGSKPGATIHNADYCIGANSAIGYYKDDFNSFKGVKISVVAASEVTNSTRNNVQKQKWNLNRKDLIINSQSDHIILVGSEYFPDVQDTFLELLNVPYNKLSYSEVFNKLNTITGLKIPLLTKNHVFPLSSNSIKNLFRFYLDFFLKRDTLVSGLFRPSTGIIALLLGIDQFGFNSLFYLEGIGLNDRNVYPDGFNNTWTPSNKILASHIYVDRLILNILLSNGVKIHIPNEVRLQL